MAGQVEKKEKKKEKFIRLARTTGLEPKTLALSLALSATASCGAEGQSPEIIYKPLPGLSMASVRGDARWGRTCHSYTC